MDTEERLLIVLKTSTTTSCWSPLLARLGIT